MSARHLEIRTTRGRTGVVYATGRRGDDRAPVGPGAGLSGVARRDADGGVLAAEGGDGVVEDVLAVDEADVGRPQRAVAGQVDLRAVGQDGAVTGPWAV